MKLVPKLKQPKAPGPRLTKKINEEAQEPSSAEAIEGEFPESAESIQIHDDSEKPVVIAKSLPAPKREWTGRDLFVGFPCYKQTNPVTAWVLVALALDFGKERVQFDMEIGDAMIYHARNRLAMKFLESPAQYLLFLDDDMVPPIGRPDFLRSMCRLPQDYSQEAASVHFATRLMGHGLDLVGATYFARHPNGRAINSLHSSPSFQSNAAGFTDRVMPCDWVGTGCMLIHRRVFEAMMAKFPELAPSTEGMPWNFFQPMTDGRGEDIAFCARARECNFQPHVDTRLQAIHVGYGTYGMHTSALNQIQ